MSDKTEFITLPKALVADVLMTCEDFEDRQVIVDELLAIRTRSGFCKGRVCEDTAAYVYERAEILGMAGMDNTPAENRAVRKYLSGHRHPWSFKTA